MRRRKTHPTGLARPRLPPNRDLDIAVERRQRFIRRSTEEPASLQWRNERVTGSLRSARPSGCRTATCTPLDRRFRRATRRPPRRRDRALPRLRRRRSTAELRDTESVAHVLLDRRRKAQEIALGGPHPMQRFLVGSPDTSHFKIIPVLGYSNRCLISAMTSKGGNRGGNRASRGVFPPSTTIALPGRGTRSRSVASQIPSKRNDERSSDAPAICRP